MWPLEAFVSKKVPVLLYSFQDALQVMAVETTLRDTRMTGRIG